MQHSKQAGLDPLAERLADGKSMGGPGSSRTALRRAVPVRLRRAARRAAAEDAAQDAFERALTALGRYSEERLRAMMFRAWLYRITLNVVRNRLRRDREVAVGGDPGTLLGVSGVGFGVRREDVMDVLAALGRLPERQRGDGRRFPTLQGVPPGSSGGVRSVLEIGRRAPRQGRGVLDGGA